MKDIISFIIVSIVVGVVQGAGDTTTVGAAFAEPDGCTSLDCTLNLTATAYNGPDGVHFSTRGFNGQVTLRQQHL